MTTPISVVIPVGPMVIYKRWLPECLASVARQTHEVAEVVMVDDMADVTLCDLGDFADELYWGTNGRVTSAILKHGKPLGTLWRAPWRLGDVAAFNSGVGLAQSELVFLLSCDDTLEPRCLELCVAEWEKHEHRDAFYWVGAHIIGPEGETAAPDQALPFGNAMITKGLWRLTGGYQPGFANGDWVFLQLLGTRFPDRCFPVAGARPLYNARSHPGCLTRLKENGYPFIPPSEWGRIE